MSISGCVRFLPKTRYSKGTFNSLETFIAISALGMAPDFVPQPMVETSMFNSAASHLRGLH